MPIVLCVNTNTSNGATEDVLPHWSKHELLMDKQVARIKAKDAQVLAAMTPKERAQKLAAQAIDKRCKEARVAAQRKRWPAETAQRAASIEGLGTGGGGSGGAGTGGNGAGDGGKGWQAAKRLRQMDKDLEANYGSSLWYKKVGCPEADKVDQRCDKGCRIADILCFRPWPGKSKKRQCASCRTGPCLFFLNGPSGVGSALATMAEVGGALGVGKEELGALGAVQRAIAHCKTAIIFAKGKENSTFKAILKEARGAEAKLVGGDANVEEVDEVPGSKDSAFLSLRNGPQRSKAQENKSQNAINLAPISY